jgi:hypothetical protein
VADELTDTGRNDPQVAVMRRALPLDRWGRYRARYAWRPAFEGLSAPDELSNVNYVNGERGPVPLRGAPAADERRAVPGTISFDDPRSRINYRVKFDEDEIVTAFEKVGAEGPVTLVLRKAVTAGTPATRALEIVAQGGTAAVTLTRFTTKVFEP